ncbi:MAG TPA: UvrD-helicase domain-containing protein [Lactovum miscens]|uniref:UvrD-helicase domain-containing protein n=1 Tax=Lactovum miscens TaxID=190387 RepID=UPI002ED955CB
MAVEKLEPEVLKALECIENKQNFILTGGAGSGKTYSLISLINEIGNKYPTKSIVCITYTNNAVAEIRNRISNNNLYVSTIHEFIWSIISKYQKEIKEILVELINDHEHKIFWLPKDFEDGQEIDLSYFGNNRVSYDEYYSLRSDGESKISHDHVLILAEKMFENFPKLCDILKDTVNFVFVDEYQDTDTLVKDILLTHTSQSSKENIVGFFGDSMQSIYENGTGEIIDNNLIRIDKMQNRRNPKAVIELANKLRDDKIIQVASTDLFAPNMKDGGVLEGNVKLIYAETVEELDSIRESKLFLDWDFDDSKNTKELWLTQKSNAKMAKFSKLYELYHSDGIIEILDRIRKQAGEGKIIVENKSFETIAREAECLNVRSRGNLFENVKNNQEYISAFEWIKDKMWEEFCDFRINSDSLLSYKFNGLIGRYEAKLQRDRILRTLDFIYELMELYKNRKINEFLRKSRQRISSIADKKMLSNGMIELFNGRFTIGQVIDKTTKIFKIHDQAFDDFTINKGSYLWQRIKNLPFSEYVHSIEYQTEHLPFATQHSIKGSEFENVLVVLDNGKWNQYNFVKMFKNINSSERVIERSKKLFYVCCTRAKNNLVVFIPTTDSSTLMKAKELFGENNVFSVEQIKDDEKKYINQTFRC